MRLQKFLSQAGIASRRAAEEIIKQGKVKVNDRVVTEMGVKVDPDNDEVKAYDKIVKLPEAKVYLMLNKPVGYLTTTRDPQGRLTVYSLLPEQYRYLFPVGRLDKNSQGLLLFTNDGDLAEQLTHPKFQHRKQYAVRVEKRLTPVALAKLLSGIELDEGIVQADELEQIDERNFLITIHQGWKRQIRRMVQAIHNEAVRLERVGLGKFHINKMKGKVWREVNKEDII